MIPESLFGAIEFLCIALGACCMFSTGLNIFFKLVHYSDSREVVSLREEIKAKSEEIVSLRSLLNFGHYNGKKKR